MTGAVSPGAGAAAARLAALGLELPAAPAPLAAYVPAVRTGDLVMTSGQLPLVAGVLPAAGLVGPGEDDVPPGLAAELARTAALNGLAAVASVLGGGVDALDRVVRVVKVTGFVASAPGFTGQPGVVDGASTLFADVLGEAGLHARSAVGVAALPLGSPVEVELVVEVR